MPITIAVCDDEQLVRNEIAGLIQSHGSGYSADFYGSGADLLDSGKRYDVYILDIQMPGASGMELAERIRGTQEYPGPVIIFVTALREYMQDAFDVQAYHYLLKPIDGEKFHAVLAGAAAEYLRRNRKEQITVQMGGTVYTVPLSDILFVESSRNKVVLHTRTNVVEYYGKISEFIAKPGVDGLFVQCHRCYVVNMEHISRFDEKSIIMADGQAIFLSRSRYPEFVKAYMQYAMK